MTDIELSKRLERLERDNRRLKRSALVLLAGVVVLTIFQTTRAVPDKITAHEFNLVDATGTTRASLGFTADEPRLWLHGYEGGKISISTLTSPLISVSSQKGVAELGLGIGSSCLTLRWGEKDWADMRAPGGLDLREGDYNRFIAPGTR